MRLSKIVTAVLAVVAGGGLLCVSRATWWDAMPHKWTEPPLVKQAEAESLRGVTGGKAVADALARGGKALRLEPGGGFDWAFQGPHSHYRFIGIVRVEGVPETISRTPLPPVFARLTVTDPKGKVRSWRVRLGYRGVYTNSLDIYFPAYLDGTYRLRLDLEKESASPLLLDWIEVRDLFGACVKKPSKTGRRLVTDEQVARMRAESAAKGVKVWRERGLKPLAEMSAEERRALFDDIWASLPPRNALVNPGRQRPELRLTPWYRPWGLLDARGEVVYDEAAYREGRKAGRIHPDDGWGYRDEKGNQVSWLGTANYQRWSNALRTVGRLSTQYLQTGDEESGWLAAMLLAAVADKWPDLDAGVHSARVFRGAGRFTHTWRPGKLGHNFWDLGNCEAFNEAYDRLFPLIRGNRELAAMLGEHVPWVRTPDDVVTYFDVQLVQHTYDLMERGVVGSSGRIPKAKIRCATILAPSALSEKIMDGVFTRLRSDLSAYYGGLAQQIACEYNRDGSSHTNGGGYAKGQAASLFEIATLTRQYVEIGGSRRFDLMDVERFPFIRAALYFPVVYRTAGGYVPGLGDWGRPWRPREFTYGRKDDGPIYRKMYAAGYRLTGDPLFAYLLVKGYGRLDEDDALWNRMVADAAKQPRHPLLSLPPRVLPGYGLIYLEDGVRYDDFHKKAAALLRVGWGLGHGHADTLNLDLYAKGVRVAPDMGSRRNRPNPRASRQHCLVEVDGHNFGAMEVSGSAASGTGWCTQFHPVPGVQFAAGEGRSQVHPYLKRYERQVALIATEDAGAPYVFDVFRVRGGRQHTWCFHGQAIDDDGAFRINVPLSDKVDAATQAYLNGWNSTVGAAADPLTAEWRMGRKWQKSMMRGQGYSPKDPPIALRSTLFSHAGDRVMTTDADPKQPFYGCRMRFLYVQRRGGQGDELATVWPAVHQTVQGEAPLKEVRRIPLGKADDDAAPVAVAVTTRAGRRDLCYADRVGGEVRDVEGANLSGAFAYWSEDAAGGFRKMVLVGGANAGKGQVGLGLNPVEYRARIVDIDYAGRTLTLGRPWPSVLAGEHVLVRRRGPNHTSYRLLKVEGRKVTFDGSPRVYQSFLKRVDPAGFVVPEIDPPLLRADDRFYDGMHAGGADGRAPWRIERIAADERTMYLGWPHYNRWKQKISWKDLPDADGDGKRSLIMTGRDGEKVRLDITRISADGYTFDFAMPADPRYQGGGWAYVLRPLTNEDGSKQWYGLYPGYRYKVYLAGAAAPTEAALAGKAGRAELNFYDMGVGDELVLAARASLSRLDDGLYELRANAPVQVTLPAAAARVLVRPVGGAWRRVETRVLEGRTASFTLDAEALGGGILQIAASEAAAKRAPNAPEPF